MSLILVSFRSLNAVIFATSSWFACSQTLLYFLYSLFYFSLTVANLQIRSLSNRLMQINIVQRTLAEALRYSSCFSIFISPPQNLVFSFLMLKPSSVFPSLSTSLQSVTGVLAFVKDQAVNLMTAQYSSFVQCSTKSNPSLIKCSSISQNHSLQFLCKRISTSRFFVIVLEFILAVVLVSIELNK